MGTNVVLEQITIQMKTSVNTDSVEVTVVIPCLNEEETIGRCIEKALRAFDRLNISGEVVVADNGSKDRSLDIAQNKGARVIHQPLKGYGNALRAGIEAAEGDFIIMGDADDSYDFSDIGKFVEKYRKGYELVMGCRLPCGGGTIMPGAMPWMHRWLGNPVLSKIGRLFFKSKITDFHCGLRGLTKHAYKKMRLNTTGMEFASEMVIKSTLGSTQMTEVPITLFKDGRSGPPHLRSWRDGWRHLRFMLLYCPRWLFLYPSLFLIFFGLTAISLTLPGPLTIKGINFSTNTMMIGALATILGVQILSFAISSRLFAYNEGFLSRDSKLVRLLRNFKLEIGLAIGILLTILGLGAVVFILFYWKQLNFGDLPRELVLRIIIPGVTAIVTGVQIVFSSFFISFLNLERRR
ncbi:glycosyltransferase [candidate division KSB1 bacterium]|nr:glycosyltransferase [candidate division KSB1 bacterium]NIV70710.1 glycosyltransferase [Phycisphaerae bacterium]NIR72675.1 glycosyltransferase [candidate division KSB1 bacterium]NIS23697.1 glycosyltransferase [candidate division KSB1 bacterium]NIT70617.1 glycosyltransferase [candidate division KSB1 bacterium]